MDSFKIQIDPDELRRAQMAFDGASEQIEADIKRLILRTTYRVAAMARKNAPSSFGKLRQSITPKAKNMTGEVAVNVDYAGAVEFGSKPHEIRPKRKRALAFKPGAGFRFWDESGRVVVKVVKHPGTEAQPFLRPAVEQEARNVGPAIKKIIDNAVNGQR